MLQKEVTPEMAKYWLENNSYTGQRSIRPRHVEYIAQAIDHNLFRKNTVITFCVLGNKHFLVNGYHTLSAIIKRDKPFPLVLEDIEVSSMEEIAFIYSTFDRNLTRSHGDIFSGHNLAEKIHIPKGTLKSYSAGIAVLVTGFTDVHKDTRSIQGALLKNPEIRVKFMLEYQKEARLYFEYEKDVSKLTRSVLQRGHVIAIGLATYRYAEHLASKFWGLLKEDSRLDKNHPSKALLTWLQQTPPKKYPDARYSRYVAACWNAFVEGRNLSKVYSRDEDLPILIQNTPFNGRDVINLME